MPTTPIASRPLDEKKIEHQLHLAIDAATFQRYCRLHYFSRPAQY